MTDIHDWHPLTEAQAGIWYAQARDPDSPVFVTGQALHIHGPLDVAALARAVSQMGQEAESLSLRFRAGPDAPCQRVVPGAVPELVLQDRRGTDPATVEAEILAEARQPMDLASGSVAAFTLWQLSDAHHILSERIHHIAADGQAMVQITQRIAALYAEGLGLAQPGAPLTGFARALEEDARFASAPARARQQAHWHAALADLPEVEPMSTGRGDGDGRWFHRAETPLPTRIGTALARRAEAAGVHWTDALVALTGAYVGRHLPRVAAGEAHEAVLGIPLQNRMGRVARTPSTQVNVLPLHLPLDEAAPLDDWLAGAGARLAEMRRHSRYRGELLARELGRIGAGRRLWGPLVNILPFDACPALPGCETRLQITGAGSVDDITFCFRGDPDSGLLAQVDTNTALYSLAESRAHLARLAGFLDAALDAERLRAVPTLTPEETRRHLEDRNATAHDVPRTTLAALIEAQMQATPDAPALVFGDTRLSYAELDRRSADVARALAGRGIGAGSLVAIALPRSVDLIVALLGALRAGAAYVPLDPEDRSDRRAGMIARADPALVLAGTDAGLGTAALSLADLLAGGQVAQPVPPAPDDPAYVLFTSGSTGRPKGVVVEHAAIVNRLLWMRETYGIGPGDRILQKTPATFDVSVWEFFLPFLSGATLVVAPPGAHRDPVALAGLVRDHAVTAMHFVPSMLELFLDAPAAQGLRIPRVFASGEALPTRLADRFHRRIEGRLFNLYGPTEAAVDVTAHEALPDAVGATVPIGRPVWNTRCYLLDAAGRPVADGVPGRLFLSGRQLARGYLGQPDLTAERFPEDPFHGGRMYDTGDLAVSDEDGVLTFLGRADDQVKIRGVRIEPGEVERAIADTGLARQAVVLVRDSAAGAQLVAWVVPAGDVTRETIRAALAHRLPQAMLPAYIVLIDRLPLSPSGKLDRRALPAPETPAGPDSHALPRTRTERLLARLYAEVLAAETTMPADTDFFLAGGDSLRAVRLCLRIEEKLGVDPGLGTILEAPVLSDLARRLDAMHVPDHGLGPMLRLSQGAPGAVPLFAVHPAGGIAWCYRTLARMLPGVPVIGLQSPLLDPEAPVPADMAALAATYMDRIDSLCPAGPVMLLGWSLGGIIAHAMTAEAEERGRRVERLVLLDSYPSESWRREPEPDETAALRALLAIAGFDPEAHRHLGTRAAIMAFLKRQGHPLAHLPHGAQAGVIRSVQSTNALVRSHRERRISAPLLHVGALRDQPGTDRSAALWRPYAGAVDSLSLDCRHPDLIGDEMTARIVAELRLPVSGMA